MSSDLPARPRPPAELLGVDGMLTARPMRPAPELWVWAKATFIDEEAPLFNPEHAHLQAATVGFVWAAEGNARQMNRVVGEAMLPKIQGSRWPKAIFTQTIEEWFGLVPDFLITLHADYAAECSDATFCALVEHELLHCGQERDGYGAPKFRKDGSPALNLRGHDVEEFVSIVARYGVGSAAGRTADLVAAASRTPLICDADIYSVCGTCGR